MACRLGAPPPASLLALLASLLALCLIILLALPPLRPRLAQLYFSLSPYPPLSPRSGYVPIDYSALPWPLPRSASHPSPAVAATDRTSCFPPRLLNQTGTGSLLIPLVSPSHSASGVPSSSCLHLPSTRGSSGPLPVPGGSLRFRFSKRTESRGLLGCSPSCPPHIKGLGSSLLDLTCLPIPSSLSTAEEPRKLLPRTTPAATTPLLPSRIGTTGPDIEHAARQRRPLQHQNTVGPLTHTCTTYISASTQSVA